MDNEKKIFSFLEIYEFAKKNSEYYKNLYKDTPDRPKIEEVPFVESTSFWQANSPLENRVMTSPQKNGIVFKSGGTSGNAKFSYFSKGEWQVYNEIFGEGMTHAAIQNNERLANFFFTGDLYAAFIFIMKSVEASNVDMIQLPLGGSASPDSIEKVLNEFKVQVWAGMPTTIMKIAEIVAARKAFPPSKILFGGESFYPDQKAHLLSLFPKCDIRSIGYATVDAGYIGFADKTCLPGEHRVFSQSSILEIIDQETLLPIDEVGKKGKFYITNLTRKLTPIIRYPVGDLGEWVEPLAAGKHRKFKIQGRSDEGARVGPTTLYYDDIASFMSKMSKLDSVGFQLVIQHFDRLDQLTIRIGVSKKNQISESELLTEFEKARPVAAEMADAQKIHRVKIQFVEADKLISNDRSGKLKRIIDERF